MSLPFEHSINCGHEHNLADFSKLSGLGEKLNEYLDERFGADAYVRGLVAYDEHKDLVDVTISNHGADVPIIDDGPNDWFAVVDWAERVGAEGIFTFVRRPDGHPTPGVTPDAWDDDMVAVSRVSAIGTETNYVGHLIFTHSETMLIEDPSPLAIMRLMADATEVAGIEAALPEPPTTTNPDQRPDVPPAFYH